MITSLPDLPYRPIAFGYGNSETRSAAKSAARKYARTDLEHLQPWREFNANIDQAIADAMTLANIEPGNSFWVPTGEDGGEDSDESVDDEETLCFYARISIFRAASKSLRRLGVQGSFCPSRAGNAAVIGEPDFCWLERAETPQHPKLVVEFKTKWAASLEDLSAFHSKTESNRSRDEKQSVEALEQIYGYMTFNNNKYGVLTNWDRTWFLRRVETNDGKTLEFAGPLRFDQTTSLSMLKAWVGMVLLAKRDWLHDSPTPSAPPPGPHFSDINTGCNRKAQAILKAGSYVVNPDGKMYPLLDLDFHTCDFQSSTVRKSFNGCVVLAHLLQNHSPYLEAMCKVADFKNNPTACASLKDEVSVYAALSHLQGTVIPKLYGYYSIWGILRLVALENVGDAITKAELPQTPELQHKMKSALGLVHAAGYIHGYVACRNFCIRGGDVFIIDLERSVPTEDKAKMESEMREIDSWFAQ